MNDNSSLKFIKIIKIIIQKLLKLRRMNVKRLYEKKDINKRQAAEDLDEARRSNGWYAYV